MLKIYLKLQAKTNTPAGYKKGDICELFNNIFDSQNGIAYYPIDKEWDIIEMELIEYKPIEIK